MPRARGTRSYPSLPALNTRPSRASIASHTNTNFRGTWTVLGIAAAGTRARARADDAGGRVHRRRAPRSPRSAADGDRTVPPTRRGPVQRTRSAPRTRADPQGHQARQRARRLRNRAGPAHRLRHRLATPARAPVAGTSRVHRGNARLHGARADGTSESLDRFPQRPLLTRRHVLRDADRQPSVHGIRSDGMGALPHRSTTGRTRRATEQCASRGVRDHDEAALQDGGGALSDRGGRRERSAALPVAMGVPGTHRRFHAGRARHSGSPHDPREAVRAGR